VRVEVANALQMAWMAPKVNYFPAASANDGLMDLVMNRSDIPIPQYLSMLMGLDDGSFFNKSCLEYSKIVAYRLTPHQESGYLSIDGEKADFKPFQVEIHPGLATVISKRGRFETPGPPGWEKFMGVAEIKVPDETTPLAANGTAPAS
jgi:sphingosine kinase